MAKFIEKNFPLGPGQTGVELGAGCGFTACHVASLASADDTTKVLATDLDSVVPLIERNISKNSLEARIKAVPLFWGNQEHLDRVKAECGGSIDLLYGADILFDFDNFEGLFSIFEELSRVFTPREGKISQTVLVGYTHRFSDVERWFREGVEAKGFIVEKATQEEFHPDFVPEPFDSFTILKL